MGNARTVEAVTNAYLLGKSGRNRFEDGFGTFNLDGITHILQQGMETTKGEKALVTLAMNAVRRYLATEGAELNGESLAKIKWADLEQRRAGLATMAFLKGFLEP